MSHVNYPETWVEATPTSTILVHVAGKVPLALPGRIGIWALLLHIARHTIYGSAASAIPVPIPATNGKPFRSFARPPVPSGKATPSWGEDDDAGMLGRSKDYTT
jgi:hypothetical protein